MNRPRPCAALVILLILTPQAARADDRAAEDFFEATVRPLLVEHCLSCHGEDRPKGGLSLTTREAILLGGHTGPAAEPGKPAESFLVEVLEYDSEPRMPPKGKLSEPEIDGLRRWIEAGMPWPGDADSPPVSSTEARPTIEDAVAAHWAFRPVREVAPPEIERPERARTTIDRFLLDRLDAEGLALAPEADRRTLIRRLSIHLTGLLPTPEEVEAFERDEGPDAYDRLVDRLLDSPHYGEHWARRWLDVARYSDTKGYVYAREEANWIHAQAYRDWVVRAINEDLPYDQFLALQVAADQLADDPEDLAAMGFLTLGRRFLGVKHDIIDDRIDVVTRGMLGMTVSCARCHDHKYDPIPTADYYALYGVFRNSAEAIVPTVTEEVRGGPDDPFEAGLAERLGTLHDRLASERGKAADRVRERVTEYLLAQFELSKYPDEAFSQILSEKDLIPASVHRWQEAFDRPGADRDPIFRPWIELTRLPASEFAERAGAICEALIEGSEGEVNPILAAAFSDPPTSREEVARRYGNVFGDVIAQWHDQLSRAEQRGEPPPEGLDDPAEEAIRGVLFGPESPCEVPDEALSNIEFFFPTQTTEALWKLQAEVDRWLIRSAGAPAHAMILVDRETTPIEPRVFRRGNSSSPGEVVPRRFLQAIAGTGAEPFREGSGRRELAEAIVDPSNPLTARVAVNRVWMGHFGEGLVRSPGDFGTRAEPPSHPDLLDWLASRFVAQGWSLKDLHRQVVRSAAFRQSSRGPSDPEIAARAAMVDPENRLLWRMPVHRLSFEELRDALLSVSGALDGRVGGPAEEMFAPPFSTRRTLYGRVDRENLPSVLRVFDFANPDLLIPQRGETTVPQQALFFLNHPFSIERARGLASRAEAVGAADDEERIRQLYRIAYQREPTGTQLRAALALVRAADREEVEGPAGTARDWQYGYGRFDEETGRVADFRALPHFDGDAWQGGPSWPDGTLGWLRLTAEGGHPGNDLNHAVVRRWVAPRDATIAIRSTLIHEVDQGDGVRGFVTSSRGGLIASVEVHQDRAMMDAERIDVRAGDTIDFVVDIRETLDSDQFLWAPAIVELSEAGGSTWDASADFSGDGTERLDAWGQLAQVLLMSNEFSFID